ncbi:MAG: zinc-ribbon domain-containing protein [Thermoplasmatota archaeon]
MTVGPIWFLIIVIATLIGFSAAILLFLEKTKDKRIANVRSSSNLDKEDEAYNAVKSAKSIINVMKRSGKNTSGAEIVIDRAELALQGRDYSRAISLAEEAKSKLEKNQQSTGITDVSKDIDRSKVDKGDSKMKKGYTIDEIDDLEMDEEDEEVKAKSEELRKQKEKIQNLPENYLESKFEIQQASDMLKSEGGNIEAEELLKQAKICFDDDDYTEALKLSLRCKKAIDEDKAGLIKFKKISKKEAEGGETGGSSENKVIKDTTIKRIEDGESTTQKTISHEGEKICPECGYEGKEGDNFCPKCGTKMEVLLTCPSCGKEVDEEDNFCPGCGNELSSITFECPECSTEVDENVKFCPKCGVEFA